VFRGRSPVGSGGSVRAVPWVGRHLTQSSPRLAAATTTSLRARLRSRSAAAHPGNLRTAPARLLRSRSSVASRGVCKERRPPSRRPLAVETETRSGSPL